MDCSHDICYIVITQMASQMDAIQLVVVPEMKLCLAKMKRHMISLLKIFFKKNVRYIRGHERKTHSINAMRNDQLISNSLLKVT